jgi:hypothetical protein
MQLRLTRSRRTMVAALAAMAVIATSLFALNAVPRPATGLPHAARERLAAMAEDAARAGVGPAGEPAAGKDFREGSQGVANGGSGGEAFEARTAAEQWAEARTAPSGIVDPGAYTAAYGQLTGLPAVGGTWSDVTAVPYDADDPAYRDYFSNSSGGSGLVTGRITALAADNAGHVYAGGADGGVFRSSTGGGHWTPMADGLPSLSSGDLQLDADGALWYATGEANTSATSFVGNGVYREAHPTTGSFTSADRVGGTELESTTINAIRFSGNTVWVATLRGVYTHPRTGSMSTHWTLRFAPNPTFLPGGADATKANAAYKNIVNDIAIDPHDGNHVIAAVGWRSGDTYNGFYETKNGGSTWRKINPTGAINPKEIGNASFAFSADGTKLYVMNQSPTLLNKVVGTVNSYLDGIYVSNNGSIAGPWTKIADSTKLANSGSALKQAIGGKGYGPGIQSWYNQFLVVDPTNRNHVMAGLEEVYETRNGGATWTTVGPYWNFYFACWAPDSVYPPNGSPNRCPQTTHPDQHSAAVGTVAGVRYLFVGNDGGVYRRPLTGHVNANGNATDWKSMNDGTMDALQYYAVDVGLANADNPKTPTNGTGALVSGGLQDNGGSLLRVGGTKMSSNFGGDGGDVLVDPNDGCKIVQEYVYLSLEMSVTCAAQSDPAAFLDITKSTTFDIAPPDINARFIAPFAADDQDITRWIAGGNSLWYNTKGFDIRTGAEWQKVHTFASPVQVATAVAFSGDTAIAGWCGPCNNAGFTRGVVVGKRSGDTWTWTDSPLTGVPNRYIGGVAVAPNGHLFIALNGFSRKFTEGPGAGIGHVFESADDGATWTDVSADFPDIPVSSIKVLASGGLVAGTDLGVVYRAPGATDWQRLGTNFPATVVTDVESGPDGYLYAATHGRGIWRITASGL